MPGVKRSTAESSLVSMVTPLQKPLKRELKIDGSVYVLTISPESLKLTPKGRRKGYELKWTELTSGDAALVTALNASIGKFVAPRKAPSVAAAAAPARKSRTRKP